MRAAIYARVTLDQEPENQLQELRRYVEASGLVCREYVDRGVSGAKKIGVPRSKMLSRARDAGSTSWSAGGSIGSDAQSEAPNHAAGKDLQALGVAFVSLAEGIDATTPAGKLQMHILGAIAEFERERIRERVLAGCSGPDAREATRTTEASIPVEQISRIAVDQRRGRQRSAYLARPSSGGADSIAGLRR